MIASCVASSLACTSFIIGKNASADGSVMVTYNADSYGSYYPFYYSPAAKHQKGEMLEIYDRLKDQSLFGDQDVMNVCYKGHIKTLSQKYNFFSNYRYFPYEELVKQSPAYERIPKDDYNDAKAHPVIVHYAGDERPWIRGNLNYYRRAYETYLELTPYKGTPKITGRELYMMAYHMMNLLTAVCPSARRKISEYYGTRIHER